MQTQYNVLFKYSYLGFNITAILYTTSFGVVLALLLLITELPKKLSAFVIPGIGYYNVTAAINSGWVDNPLEAAVAVCQPWWTLQGWHRNCAIGNKIPLQEKKWLDHQPCQRRKPCWLHRVRRWPAEAEKAPPLLHASPDCHVCNEHTRMFFFCVCVHLPAEYNCRGWARWRAFVRSCP